MDGTAGALARERSRGGHRSGAHLDEANARGRLRAWLELGRVSNLPTIGTQTAAAIAIAIAAGAPVDVLDVVGLGGGFAASYTAGMFLNDAFDRHFDARHRPDRPIPALRLTAAEVFGAGFALLAFGAGLTVLVASRHGHALAGAAGALALSFAIVLYDVWHKGNPLAPLVMGACRGLVYLAAVLGLTGTLDPLAIVAALAMVAYVAGLTDVARSKGAPPVRGAVALGVAPIVLAAASLVVGRSVLGALAAAALATVAAAALRHAKDGHGERAVVLLLAGLSLVDATLLASTGHPLLGVAAVVAMPLTRKLQAFVRGT